MKMCRTCGVRPIRGAQKAWGKTQSYCQGCQNVRDLENARARREKYRTLQEEVKRLRALLRDAGVAVPDMEC